MSHRKCASDTTRARLAAAPRFALACTVVIAGLSSPACTEHEDPPSQQDTNQAADGSTDVLGEPIVGNLCDPEEPDSTGPYSEGDFCDMAERCEYRPRWCTDVLAADDRRAQPGWICFHVCECRSRIGAATIRCSEPQWSVLQR